MFSVVTNASLESNAGTPDVVMMIVIVAGLVLTLQPQEVLQVHPMDQGTFAIFSGVANMPKQGENEKLACIALLLRLNLRIVLKF